MTHDYRLRAHPEVDWWSEDRVYLLTRDQALTKKGSTSDSFGGSSGVAEMGRHLALPATGIATCSNSITATSVARVGGLHIISSTAYPFFLPQNNFTPSSPLHLFTHSPLDLFTTSLLHIFTTSPFQFTSSPVHQFTSL